MAESPGHRPRATGNHRLIGRPVAHVQEGGAHVAETHTDLLTQHTTAVAHRPRLEAGEDGVQSGAPAGPRVPDLRL